MRVTGLALPGSPRSLATAGCEAMERYHQRWASRASWYHAYEGCVHVSSSGVRGVVGMLLTTAPDVCTVAHLAGVLDSIRRQDPVFMAHTATSDVPRYVFPDPLDGDPEPVGEPTVGVPRLSIGCARASYGEEVDGGAPRSGLLPYCPYCIRLSLLLEEAGHPHEAVRIDLNGKQAWYVAAYAPAEVPAMQGLPYGPDATTWFGGTPEIKRALAANHAGVAEVLGREGVLSEDDAMVFAECLIYGSFALNVAGTKAGAGFLKFCAGKLLAESSVQELFYALIFYIILVGLIMIFKNEVVSLFTNQPEIQYYVM